jgi:hypothetical protein
MPIQEGYVTETRKLAFDQREQQQYQSLAAACKRAILVGSKGDSINKKAHTAVMQALLRLRIFCNNGESTIALSNSVTTNTPAQGLDEDLSRLQQSGEAACADCSIDILTVGDLSDSNCGFLTQCGRLVCDECKQLIREDSTKGGGTYTCNFCNLSHSDNGGRVLQTQPAPEDKQFSSKIRCLIDDIQFYYQESKWSVI